MASTNKTTNYELSQFIETDRPAWLTDYNGDMRTIDSTMKAISDVASGASGSISELADRMSTAEGNITTNTNDIDALEARADSLEAQAQSTAGTIANIQTEQTAQNLGIEAATELGYNLARPYDSASTYAVGDYVLFQNTLYKCVTAIATGEAFDPTKWLAIKATDEIAAGGYTLPIASASQLGGVKIGSGLSIDPVTGLLSASGFSHLEGAEVLTFGSFASNFTLRSSEVHLLYTPTIKILLIALDLTVLNGAAGGEIPLPISNWETTEFPITEAKNALFAWGTYLSTDSSPIRFNINSARITDSRLIFNFQSVTRQGDISFTKGYFVFLNTV